MQVTVKHIAEMTFEGVGKSGEVTKIVASSADTELKGASPMELVLMGIASCSGVDIINILEKMRLKFDRFEISVEGERAPDYSRVFTAIDVIYRFWGSDLPEKRIKHAIELSMDKYCSVINMVNKTAKINYKLEIE